MEGRASYSGRGAAAGDLLVASLANGQDWYELVRAIDGRRRDLHRETHG